MIRVRVVCVGKLRERHWREACAEYEKRLARFCKLEICELAERRTPEEEQEEILRSLRGETVVLAVEGREVSSEEFSGLVGGYVDRGAELTFVIGSSEGLAQGVKAAAKEKISFSRMTFPHQMFRAVLLEQLYRAFMIRAGSEYHK